MKCLQCDKKVGWLKRPVDASYCSVECRDRALEASAEQRRTRALALEAELEQREADMRAKERERLEIEAAMLRGKSEIVLKPVPSESPCPKCGSVWSQASGAGSMGRHLGECGACGFRAEFIAIESCTNCRCQSLIIESQDDARCPRCKSRPRRRRQIA
ncbi:MAG TPA: hypothetical protein VH062_16110 [Polyangiaceae bacterium]|jgi:hypothetical protein|nr:hypothetical protein [Polyangiaceae bacterium]